VMNQGDGWDYTVNYLIRFLEDRRSNLALAEDVHGAYLELVKTLATRTAELHRALSTPTADEAFSPEPIREEDLAAWRLSVRADAEKTLEILAQRARDLPEPVVADIDTLLSRREVLLKRIDASVSGSLRGLKTRYHGDYHLGQILNTGNDFVILDFEGEPRKTLGERLLKRSPLVDVAGMLRSIDYAVRASLAKQKTEDLERLRPWTRKWRVVSSRAFLEGYQATAAGASFLPKTDQEFQLLLKAYLLDKAVYEVGYELNYRPDFVSIPMAATDRILASEALEGEETETQSQSAS